MTLLITSSRPQSICKIAQATVTTKSSSTRISISATAFAAASATASSSSSKSDIFILSKRFLSYEDEGSSKRDKLTDVLIKVIDSKPRVPPKPSPEEAERRYKIGRQYVIGKFNQHNDLEHDLACKIKMKQHAIALLPKADDEDYGYLKKAAMTIDTSDEAFPPYWRPIPVDTPPIPGFDPSKYIDEEGEK